MPYKSIEDKRAAFRRWYLRNRDQHMKKVRLREKRRKLEYKEKLVQLLGGKCIACGYSDCFQALDFHHTDPSTKNASVGELLHTARSWESVLHEAKKCVLLCANCHREEHYRTQ